MLIFLVRHAESTWNRLRKIQGQKNPELSDYGKKEAMLLRRRLRDIEVKGVYSSPLRRAYKTACIAVGSKKRIEIVPDLKEISLGKWEGKTLASIRKEYGDRFDKWALSPTRIKIPEGEDFLSFARRVKRAMESIEKNHRDGIVLVFAHGGVISTYVTQVLNLPVDDVWCLTVKNASLTIVEIDGRLRRLVTFNDIGHLITLKASELKREIHVD
ncbi:MAG: histidine phosphatase family protein [bacterium]